MLYICLIKSEPVDRKLPTTDWSAKQDAAIIFIITLT